MRGQETGRGRRRRIAEVIGDRLEPLTRFKGGELRELVPDTGSSAELVVTTRQRIDLDIETTTHPGHLPPEAVACPHATALDAEMQQRLVSAETTTAARIQQWATEEPGQYRRLLPAQGLFDAARLGGPVGTEWPCAPCGQRGQVTCNGCAGAGTQGCPDCQGRCRGPCRDCRGLGRRACSRCEGRGQVRLGTPADPEAVGPCTACSQGWLGCTACAGRGEQDCARCATSGRVPCPDCQGRQTLDCPGCGTTGWQHRLDRLRERRTLEDRLEVQHPDPAVAAAIAARHADAAALATLTESCTLEQVRYTTAPLAVQAVQRLRLAVQHATLQVAGQALSFTALGPALEVVDFQQVAARLLDQDLVTLEKNTHGSGRHLDEALRRFLQSPLNREIAARTDGALDIAREHPGLVDAAYQRRAAQAVEQAIERLWRQRVWRPTFACLGGVGLVSGLLVALGSPQVGVAGAAGAAVALGGVAWIGVEWQQRRHLARSLDIPHGDRLLHPLRQAKGVRRWQMKSLAAAVVVALASAVAMTRLPHVRQHAEQARATATLAQQLDAWLVSEGKDYRLRRYPPAEALVAVLDGAADHSQQAQARLVRAWQLLLGPDGVATDPQEAERLLASGPRDPRLVPATVIGQARATLLLRGRSAGALQAAAVSLEALPDPPPEALHTLALIQLAPPMASRAGGTAQGLATLQQAADLGHASACFELGRRLASGSSGSGVRRDVAAARRYLAYAEAKGVPGAAQVLASLR